MWIDLGLLFLKCWSNNHNTKLVFGGAPLAIPGRNSWCPGAWELVAIMSWPKRSHHTLTKWCWVNEWPSTCSLEKINRFQPRNYVWNIAHCSDPEFGGSMLEKKHSHFLLILVKNSKRGLMLNSPYIDIYLQLMYKWKKHMRRLSPTRIRNETNQLHAIAMFRTGNLQKNQQVRNWVIELPWRVFSWITLW